MTHNDDARRRAAKLIADKYIRDPNAPSAAEVAQLRKAEPMSRSEQWWLDLPGSKIAPKEFDELMRNSVELLKGANDPRLLHITAYMRHQKAKADFGMKARRAEFAEEEPVPVPPASFRHPFMRRF
jgi:hypothetical protein